MKKLTTNQVNNIIKTTGDYLASISYYIEFPILEKLVIENLTNKSYLIDLLSQHPTWDVDTMSIHVDGKFFTKMNGDDEYDDDNDDNLFYALIHEQRSTHSRFYRLLGMSIEGREADLISDAVASEFNSLILSLTTQSPSSACAVPFETKLKVRAGAKLSKVLLRFLTELQSYFVENKLSGRAQICADTIREFGRRIESKTVAQKTQRVYISVHPISYFTMSYGDSWSSCHCIKEGGYKSGTMSYAIDKSTMTAFVLSKKEDNILTGKKHMRQMLMLNDSYMIGSRVYPQNSSVTAQLVCETVMKELGLTFTKNANSQERFVRDNSKTTSGATHYPDYSYDSYFNGAQYSINGSDSKTLLIGAKPICMTCGKEHSDGNRMYCDTCSGVMTINRIRVASMMNDNDSRKRAIQNRLDKNITIDTYLEQGKKIRRKEFVLENGRVMPEPPKPIDLSNLQEDVKILHDVLSAPLSLDARISALDTLLSRNPEVMYTMSAIQGLPFEDYKLDPVKVEVIRLATPCAEYIKLSGLVKMLKA